MRRRVRSGVAADPPSRARAVVIGGGVIGCSVAYHLTRRGWRDVVLLERKQLTSGTTWHAAGLIGVLRATRNLTRLAQYSAELYARLEAETEQATGYERSGSISIATDSERLEELLRDASMARDLGVEAVAIDTREILAHWPHAQLNDVVGGVYLPGDGHVGPVDVTRALAIGARQAGAKVIEHIKVTDILTRGGRAAGVMTDRGEIESDVVVNCGGIWAREIGRLCGVDVPLHAAEHFYMVTEPVEGLPEQLPTLREPGACAYFKREAGGRLLVGFFEPQAHPWGMDGIPEDFEFDELPDNWSHLEPWTMRALERIPVLANTGIRRFFNGPESFTPDDSYLLGEAPELPGFFVAAGFNSIGVGSAGGAGKALADWIVDGSSSLDLHDVDLKRMMPFQANAAYLADRTVESLGLLYAMHWPNRQFETARGVRRSPLHDRLADCGACFGELAGWERANWFAPEGAQPEYTYSFGRQNWFEYSAEEHRAVRERVGLFDQTSFGKLLLQGPDAEAVLQRVCAADVAVEPGRVVYTQWLNERGGIESDLTVTRIDAHRYLIVTAAACQVRDRAWLTAHLPEGARAEIVDVTSAWSVLAVMGPDSRELLSAITRDDLSNTGFPFATSREIDLGYARVRATRITYVGELGWELYIPTEFALGVYDAIVDAGEPLGLRHAGYHALNSLRIEKGYRHWGHDITSDDTPMQAGLTFAVDFDKPTDFIGRRALVAAREQRLTRRLVTFTLEDPEPLLYHNEPVWCDGERVGYITSGMFGHTIGRSVGLGYVGNAQGVDREDIASGAWEIEIAGARFGASATLRPLYDASNERIRA